MPISDSQKVDFLWKKIGFGATKTDVSAIKDATNEAIPSPLLLRGDIIWVDAVLVPAVIPAFNDIDAPNPIVRIYSDNPGANPTFETIEDITASPRRTWLTNEANWIPPEFGSTYQIKVYIDNPGASAPQTTGSQVFAAGSGNNDEWFFDYKSGVLNFIGNNLPSTLTSGKRIYISGARYIGSLGLKGEGGLLGDLTIDKTTISTVQPDLDIILDPIGLGEVVISSDLTVENNLNVEGNVNLDNDLNVGGDLNLDNDLNVGGDLNLDNNLNVGGDLNLDSNLNVENDVNIRGDLIADNIEGDIDGGFF
jgi:cytoskeletal protein CcmA (bactofilin family)